MLDAVHDAHFVEADTLAELVEKLEGVDEISAQATLDAYNGAVDDSAGFDPTCLDGKGTNDLRWQSQTGRKSWIKAPSGRIP